MALLEKIASGECVVVRDADGNDIEVTWDCRQDPEPHALLRCGHHLDVEYVRRESLTAWLGDKSWLEVGGEVELPEQPQAPQSRSRGRGRDR